MLLLGPRCITAAAAYKFIFIGRLLWLDQRLAALAAPATSETALWVCYFYAFSRRMNINAHKRASDGTVCLCPPLHTLTFVTAQVWSRRTVRRAARMSDALQRALQCCLPGNGKAKVPGTPPPYESNGGSDTSEVRSMQASRMSIRANTCEDDVDTILGRLEKLDDERQDLQQQLQRMQAAQIMEEAGANDLTAGVRMSMGPGAPRFSHISGHRDVGRKWQETRRAVSVAANFRYSPEDANRALGALRPPDELKRYSEMVTRSRHAATAPPRSRPTARSGHSHQRGSDCGMSGRPGLLGAPSLPTPAPAPSRPHLPPLLSPMRASRRPRRVATHPR